MKKKQTIVLSSVESILTIAGISLVSLGIFANLASVPNNLQYINDGFDMVYYYRYIILLGGGFLIGILAGLRKSKLLQDKLFRGAVYALIAMSLYAVLDSARLMLTQDLAYPWGKVVFSGLPLVALLLALVIAATAELKAATLSTFAKNASIFLFLFGQVYLVGAAFLFVPDGAMYRTDTITIVLSAAYYITHPLVIALLAYLLLGAVKHRIDRLFYGMFIGAFGAYLSLVLWEFRTDPTVTATNIFSAFVLAIVATSSTLLILKARSAAKLHVSSRAVPRKRK